MSWGQKSPISNSGLKQSDMYTYQVSKLTSNPDIDARWDKALWRDIPALELTHFMGERPEHFPAVEAKLAYNDLGIYVIFRVEDQYVQALRSKHQEGVYKDSCVEFFFSPAKDSEAGYFNLEMNCGGTMLFHHQEKPRAGQPLTPAAIAEVTVAHSLPKIVSPEITEPVTWTVEYGIPFSILKDIQSFDLPTSGTIWRANLYKCADETSHPHWLTWAPIDLPQPNFHVPDFFGTLVFE
jgi:hypothetical protein